MRFSLALFLTLVGGAALVVPAFAAEPEPAGSKVFVLNAQNGSGETGTVALKPRGRKTDVEIHILHAPAGVSQPAHIHAGSCAKLDPTPKYALEPSLDGTSDITIAVPMAKLLAMPMAINVHKSADDLKDYVACADLKD